MGEIAVTAFLGASTLAIGYLAASDGSKGALALVAVVTFGVVCRKPILTLPVVVTFFLVTSWESPTKQALGLLAIASFGCLSQIAANSVRWPPLATAISLAILLFLLVEYVQISGSTDVLSRLAAILASFLTVPTVLGSGERSWTDSRRLIAAMTVIGAAESAIGLAQAMAHRLILPSWIYPAGTAQACVEIPGFFRATGTLGHPNALALTLIMTLPFALYGAGTSTSAKRKWLAAVVLIAVGCIATLSRSGFLALVAAGLCLALLPSKRRSHRRAAALGFLSAVAVLGIIGPFARLTSTQDVSVRDSGSDAARLANMGAALRNWLTAPITGHGLGTSAVLGVDQGGYAGLGAHNTYLDILEGGGVVLALLLLSLGLTVLRRPLRTHWKVGSPLFLIAPLVVVTGLFETLLQSGFVCMIWGAFALLVRLQPVLESSPHALQDRSAADRATEGTTIA
ncbi:MAG: O-antigen ligase family protein [Actinomycetales bacterium]